MTTVMFRSNPHGNWRPASPLWKDIPKHRAEEIAEYYNEKYSHGQWKAEEE